MRLKGLNITFKVGVDNDYPTSLIINGQLVELWLDTYRSTKRQLHFVVKASPETKIIIPRTHRLNEQGVQNDTSERDQENFNR